MPRLAEWFAQHGIASRQLIEAGENLGFAAGCNLGLRVAESLGLVTTVFLNNDTVVPAKNLLGAENKGFGLAMATLDSTRPGTAAMAVGIFAIGEALWVAAHLSRRPADIIPTGRAFMSREDWSRSWKPWLRGTALGFPFGALPAGGAEILTLP